MAASVAAARARCDLRAARTTVRSAFVSVPEPPDHPLRAKLRSEVLPASWADLLYQFARGGLFLVDPEGDLLDVAEAIANDDRPRIEALLQSASLRRASDDDART